MSELSESTIKTLLTGVIVPVTDSKIRSSAKASVREGRVTKLSIQGNQVTAFVAGTQPQPFDVSLSCEPFTAQQRAVSTQLAHQEGITAHRYASGEWPESVFLHMLPSFFTDITAHCSCPGDDEACRHITAVWLALSERISASPTILLGLRTAIHVDSTEPQSLRYPTIAFWDQPLDLPLLTSLRSIDTASYIESAQGKALAQSLYEDPIEQLRFTGELSDLFDRMKPLS